METIEQLNETVKALLRRVADLEANEHTGLWLVRADLDPVHVWKEGQFCKDDAGDVFRVVCVISKPDERPALVVKKPGPMWGGYEEATAYHVRANRGVNEWNRPSQSAIDNIEVSVRRLEFDAVSGTPGLG